MKNVLHICDYAASYKGNFIESLETLGEIVEKSGSEQIYLFPYRASKNPKALAWVKEIEDKGRKVFFQKKSFLANIFLINSICRKNDIRNIVRHFSDVKVDAILKFFCRKKHIVHFFHGEYSAQGIKHKIRQFLFHKRILVGVSLAVSQNIQEYFPKENIIPIANAINFERLENFEPSEKNDNINCMIMGYNWKIKGVDLAVKAVKTLRNSYENLVLRIVAASHIKELEEMLQKELGGKPDWIEILPSRPDIATYYRSMNIFLSPSRSEGFSYSIPEAAFCNCEIVASKIPAQLNLEVEGINWFEKENVMDFVNALENAILNPMSDQQKADRRLNLQKTYNLDAWAHKVLELLV